MRMVRNLRILKCCLWMPTRFCLKKIGPGESILMARQRMSSSGESTIMPQRDRITASSRLMPFRYMEDPPFSEYLLL